jgi:hypothetical protein
MKKPRKRTRRGIKFDSLAEDYKILKSPLVETCRATAEHFDETDPPIDEPTGRPEPSRGAEND